MFVKGFSVNKHLAFIVSLGSEIFRFFHFAEFFHDLDMEVDVFLFDLKFLFREFGDGFIFFLQLVLELSDLDLVFAGPNRHNRCGSDFFFFKLFFE